jgi:CRISPR system Cascade subunit CasC
MKKVFVDFHVIQTVPPSCVNRDDTGSPKTAVYGGVRRARVSSQSWKRAIREMFREHFDEADLGVRTKKIVELVAGQIIAQDSSKNEEEAAKLAEKVINAAAVSTKDGEAKALFFMSRKQAQNLAELALNGEPDKKEAQAALNKGCGVDIALFGRMVADAPALNTDASAQVAHSISTHRVDNEYDYFTAMDDLSPEDTAGAGMIGTVEYNSSTLYRYATIAAHELYQQLVQDPAALAKAVKEFARAFITSMPTGKQNTFANRTLPDAVMVAIRADQPINLVGAFEEAIKDQNKESRGFAGKSVEKLAAYADSVYSTFASQPQKTYVIGTGLSSLGELVHIDVLLQELEGKMEAEFSNSDNNGGGQ